MAEIKESPSSQFLAEGDHVYVAVPSIVRIGRIRGGEVRVSVELRPAVEFVTEAKRKQSPASLDG